MMEDPTDKCQINQYLLSSRKNGTSIELEKIEEALIMDLRVGESIRDQEYFMDLMSTLKGLLAPDEGSGIKLSVEIVALIGMIVRLTRKKYVYFDSPIAIEGNCKAIIESLARAFSNAAVGECPTLTEPSMVAYKGFRNLLRLDPLFKALAGIDSSNKSDDATDDKPSGSTLVRLSSLFSHGDFKGAADFATEAFGKLKLDQFKDKDNNDNSLEGILCLLANATVDYFQMDGHTCLTHLKEAKVLCGERSDLQSHVIIREALCVHFIQYKTDDALKALTEAESQLQGNSETNYYCINIRAFILSYCGEGYIAQSMMQAEDITQRFIDFRKCSIGMMISYTMKAASKMMQKNSNAVEVMTEFQIEESYQIIRDLMEVPEYCSFENLKLYGNLLAVLEKPEHLHMVHGKLRKIAVETPELTEHCLLNMALQNLGTSSLTVDKNELAKVKLLSEVAKNNDVRAGAMLFLAEFANTSGADYADVVDMFVNAYLFGTGSPTLAFKIASVAANCLCNPD